jgi:hypothetical protein
VENKHGADGKNPASATVNKPLTDVGDQPLVYKVGRLTRSLANFAKVVELFSAPFVSFAAVTPQFNTTTSMVAPCPSPLTPGTAFPYFS